jgi:AAA15 family ATPase/GTPase
MAKKYLHSIELQNFKAFPEYANIVLNGKHAIIWGVNGSGKSSIYWAVYTFLQCSSKGVDGQKKYFNKGELSLHNILAPAETESFLKLSFREKGTPDTISYKLSETENDSLDEYIRGIDNSSEFVTHRLLLNFYHYKHSQKINLYPVFDRDIFPYFKTSKGTNFNELLKRIESNLFNESKKNLEAWEKEFNDGLEDLIQPIKRDEVNKFYNKHLAKPGESIEVQIHFQEFLKVEGLTKPKLYRSIKYPEITLKAKFGVNSPLHTVNKPQSFFNEARINAIALSIRFVLMKERKSAEGLNLLVLDDLLISLDMQNRLKVIKMILKEYGSDYQIIIFTHDKGFLNEVLRQIGDDKDFWQVIRMYETPINENPKIEYDCASNIDRAIDFYGKHEFDVCALYLRKEVEEILATFIDPELSFIWKSKDWRGLADFLTSAENKLLNRRYGEFKRLVNVNISLDDIEKLRSQIEIDPLFDGHPELLGPLTSYRAKVFNFIKNVKEEDIRQGDVKVLIDNIKKIKDRVLNPGAHFGEAPFFEQEIEEAITIVKELKVTIDKIKAASV